jgi:DNA-binding CsgD family transcriptional regulator
LVAEAETQLIYTAEIYWLAGRVEADRAEAARIQGTGDAGKDAVVAAGALVAMLAEGIALYLDGGAPPEALAFEALLRGECARARGRSETAAWEDAARRFGELSQPYRAAYAEMRAAEARALAGTPARQIAEQLRRAHAVALELGITPFRKEVESLARRTGITLGARERDDVAEELGLTERELEVLALLADGRTNREIARELFITDKTASAHVSHILTKLGVANRAAAAAGAQRLGLTRPRA